MDIDEVKAAVIARAEHEGWGKGTTVWRLRDWGVSRQRYWGTPIPFIHCPACGLVPVPKGQLPIVLPEDADFSVPGNPLDRHPTWKHTSCPSCGGEALRETDTLEDRKSVVQGTSVSVRVDLGGSRIITKKKEH